MKIIIGAVAVLVLLSAITPSGFALSAHQSGFEHGVLYTRDRAWPHESSSRKR